MALPSQRIARRNLLLFLAPVLLVVVWLGVPWAVERSVHSLLEHNDLAGHRISFAQLEVDPWAGDLRISGLHVAPSAATLASDTAMQVVGEAQLVELQGVRIRKLLFGKQLHATRIHLRAPEIHHTHSLRPDHTRGSAASDLPPSATIAVDTLWIEGGSGTSTDRSGTRSVITVDHFDLRVVDLHAYTDSSEQLAIGARNTHIALRDVHADVPPFHTLSVGLIEWDQDADSVRVYNTYYRPVVSPDEYHTRVDHQTELMELALDSLVLRGFSPLAVALRGQLMARNALVNGMHMQLHRDKSVALDSTKHKPLPSELLRSLAHTVAVDSVWIHNGRVDYSERTDRNAPYGTLAFTHIHGLLTGMDNTERDDPADLHLHGNGRIEGQGKAQLDMRMDMHPGSTGITLQARISSLPFAVLNRMTDELMHVSATAGSIHHVELHMHGNAKRARGTVKMHYEDLHLSVEKGIHHARPLGLLANALIRGNNMPHQRHYREGHFTVERHTGKGVFNYLWLGMRAGMLEVMLPPHVLKRMKKRAAHA